MVTRWLLVRLANLIVDPTAARPQRPPAAVSRQLPPSCVVRIWAEILGGSSNGPQVCTHRSDGDTENTCQVLWNLEVLCSVAALAQSLRPPRMLIRGSDWQRQQRPLMRMEMIGVPQQEDLGYVSMCFQTAHLDSV